MSLPDAGSLEAHSVAELRDLVGVLVAQVEQQQATITALRAENQALRDEMARLKGLPSTEEALPLERVQVARQMRTRCSRVLLRARPPD